MNKIVKKKYIWIVSIIGVGLIAWLGVVIYAVGYLFYFGGDGCGMDDGPFIATKIKPIEITKTSERFKLSKGGELILTNRDNTLMSRDDILAPVLTLIENGKVKWTLETDVRNRENHENHRIWKISNLTITKKTDPIKLSFTGHWTFGAEAGRMKIDRENGDSSFCLSW